MYFYPSIQNIRSLETSGGKIISRDRLLPRTEVEKRGSQRGPFTGAVKLHSHESSPHTMCLSVRPVPVVKVQRLK